MRAGGLQFGETLGAILRESATRHADRTALWVDGCAITYEELFARASCIASALHQAGVAGPDRRCAILGARSASAFAGVMGAVLARSTYVPLNPRHPGERLSQVINTARADALVVDEKSFLLAQDLLGRVQRPLIILLPDAVTSPGWAVAFPQHRFLCRRDLEHSNLEDIGSGEAEDGAYLLFTSGSTGAPKGVLVRQRNVTAYLSSVYERYRPGPDDRFTQLFDLTFDLSVHDMFLCWGAGAALYCPPENLKMAPRDFVRRNDLTFWFSVPSTASFMAHLRMLRPGDFPSLRWSLFCGEALPRGLAQAWATAAPNSVIENLYGPTETTIAITAYRLPSGAEAIARLPEVVPIGLPLPGQKTMVLDTDCNRCGPGADGELCVAGSQVTDGYWGQPDLTAERFPTFPHLAPAVRWYRTGDHARITADYGLVFLGRVDRQVKVGGHRVELLEVEAALRRISGASNVAAIAWPVDPNGLVRGIVAFVADETMASDAILQACRRALPPYMVPSRLYPVADWPVSDSGKTDYGRLRRIMEQENDSNRESN